MAVFHAPGAEYVVKATHAVFSMYNLFFRFHISAGYPNGGSNEYTAGRRLFVDGQNIIKIRDADFGRGKILRYFLIRQFPGF